MKVFVVGSTRDPSFDDAKHALYVSACEEIGRQLARRKHSLIVNSARPNTADPHVVKGMNATDGVHKVTVFRPAEEYLTGADQPLRCYAPVEKVLSKIKFRYPRETGNFRVSHLRSLEECDVVLALAGTPTGTLTVIYSAEVLRRPVVLIKGFGGASETAWNDFEKHFSDENRAALDCRGQAIDESWAVKVVDELEKIRRGNPYFRMTWKAVTALIIAVVLSVIGWVVMLMSLSVDNKSVATVLVLLMCLLASFVGAAGRRVALGLKYHWQGFHPRNIALEWLAGVIASVVVVMVTVATGSIIANSDLEFRDDGGLRKSAFTLSMLVVLLTLFVEHGWEKLHEFLKRSSDI